MSSEDKRLKSLRGGVNSLDEAILLTLSLTKNPRTKAAGEQCLTALGQTRDEMVSELGQIKERLGLPVCIPAVEEEKLDILVDTAVFLGLPLTPAEIKDFFRSLFARAKSQQEKQRAKAACPP